MLVKGTSGLHHTYFVGCNIYESPCPVIIFFNVVFVQAVTYDFCKGHLNVFIIIFKFAGLDITFAKAPLHVICNLQVLLVYSISSFVIIL